VSQGFLASTGDLGLTAAASGTSLQLLIMATNSLIFLITKYILLQRKIRTRRKKKKLITQIILTISIKIIKKVL
jgi:hypothetical protein